MLSPALLLSAASLLSLNAPSATKGAASPALAVDHAFERIAPSLDALYQDLHRAPELSGQEVKTAARMALELRRIGLEVTENVGGHGVVGVLRNGKGPTLLLRTELDALPILEATHLPFASESKGVMHACGHDVHMSAWVGAAEVLSAVRERWNGTLVMVAQPAEETVGGARAMIADGLFARFPKPNFAVAVHDRADLPAGEVTWVAGYTMANVDSVELTIHGRGGHGARPEKTIDPVVIAARTVLALQTIVSREKDPLEPAVLSVGSIHGGSKFNIIPDEVKLQLTVRSYNPDVQKQILAGIERISKAEAAAAGAPRDPTMVLSEGQGACLNDPALTRRIAARLAHDLGAGKVKEGRPDMVSEDFGEFGKQGGFPSVLLRIGAVSESAWQGGAAVLPSLHSATFAPDRGPTIRTGATVLALSALELLGAK